MAGVFLSYSRSDHAFAEQIIRGLRRLDVEVWWDEDMPGVDWQEELERQISHLAGVVVLWTANSAASKNVKDEARLGLSTDKLVNVLVGAAQPPFPFDRVNGLPLDGWTGREPHRGWTRLVQTIEAMLVAVGGAQPGEIIGALALQEEDASRKQRGLTRAQDAYRNAQIREADAAEAAKAAREAFERAEEQYRRIVEMRPAPMILSGAQGELEAARAGRDEAERSLRAAKTRLSETSRALARANTALEALFADSEPRPAMIMRPIEPPPEPQPAPPPTPAVPRRPQPWPWLAAAGLALAVIIGGAGAVILHHGSNSTAPPSPPPAESGAQDADAALSGVWHGTAQYVGTGKPIVFDFDAHVANDQVTGRITERNTFAPGGCAYLYSNVQGSIDANVLQFTKTYDGTCNQTHSVGYTGAIDRSNDTVTGTWKIPGTGGARDTVGQFTMALGK